MISSTEEPLFFITVITLLIFIERPSLIDGSSSFLIKGNKVTCTEEGQVMTFSFLKNPCITCLCRNSVVDCFEETCPEAHNCFFTLPNSTNNCCTQCKGCKYVKVSSQDYDSNHSIINIYCFCLVSMEISFVTVLSFKMNTILVDLIIVM